MYRLKDEHDRKVYKPDLTDDELVLGIVKVVLGHLEVKRAGPLRARPEMS